ncbi:MAG: MMPL family transporter [Acidimicrobiia bacterium]
MVRLADFCYRRRRFVVLAWILALVAVMAAGMSNPAEFHANYQTPGAEATRAYELLAERFPARKGDAINVVFHDDRGVDTPAVRAVADGLLADLADFKRVTGVVSPFTPEGKSQISADGKVAYAEIDFEATIDKLISDDSSYMKDFLDVAKPGDRDGVQVEVTNFVSEQSLGSEAIGLVFAAFILLLAFGSLLAMGLPILTALFGLGIGATVGGLLTHVFETPQWATTVASMIGIGVGIDYALFIITRYRTALGKGLSPREAVITAMGTAGKAVLFAGGTVVISMLGMLTMNLGYLHGVVASSVAAVLAMLTASLTLLPAVLGFVGTNIDRLRVPFTKPSTGGTAHGFWYRWSRIVQNKPWVAFGSGAVVLLVLTVPLFGLRLGFPDDGNNRTEETSRRAYDLMTEGFGPGFNGPLVIVSDLSSVKDRTAFANHIAEQAKAADGVASVSPVITNQQGDAAIVNVYPSDKPQSKQTEQLVKSLRRDILTPIAQENGAGVYVGGFTAISIDQARYISGRLPLFIGAVVFLSFLLLTTVFRSPLVALKAGIMNLLSISAAFGVMSFSTHDSWLGHLLRIPETPVPAFVPMIMFAILFGLSMDYEVFLLSRIREEYLHTGDNGRAVADGLAATARVITAAAAIMVFVFGVFIFDPNAFIKQIGLGLATAVLVDATIVRMVLVPATMELLGNANWWMPRWLDRLLPEVHIEGEAAVEAQLDALLAEPQTA